MATPWYIRAKARADSQGLSLVDIADKLGVTPSSIGHYFSGRRHPKPGMLKNLSEILEISVSELVEDDPSFARNAVEHAILEELRAMPSEDQARWLSVLKAVNQASVPVPKNGKSDP